MRIYIFPNLTAARYYEKVLYVFEKLEELSYEIVLNKEDSIRVFGDDKYAKYNIEDCELILSLGGDGTFLRASKLAVEYDLPICGINCGNLGYLCTYRLDEMDEIDFKSLRPHTYHLLESDINSKEYLSINDVVIGKDYFGGTVRLKVSINDKELYTYKGDGIIIAGCLGSTAYNKSAGGYIIKEDDDLIALTPICPSDENVKAQKISKDSIIKIELLDDLYDASIYIDGEYVDKLDVITVKYSDKYITMLKR